MFSKILGYNEDIKKSIAFLYNSDEQSENETKKPIPFIMASKKIQYLGIKLAKEV